MLDSITYSDKVFSMSIPMFLASIFLALALGIGTALVFQFRTKHTASMATTLAIMPPAIALVIMLVNGNIGAGVAVAGSFALVRFRSAPGTGREIAAVFAAMAVGLAAGMGYLAAAALFFVCYAALTLALAHLRFGGADRKLWRLRITVPENVDYTGLFDDVFAARGISAELVRVKSVSMGTLFELTYDAVLPDGTFSRQLLDELRVRNGNLTILAAPAGETDRDGL